MPKHSSLMLRRSLLTPRRNLALADALISVSRSVSTMSCLPPLWSFMLSKEERNRFHSLRDFERAKGGIEGLRSPSRGAARVVMATGVNPI